MTEIGHDVNESWRKALLVCGILSSLLYGDPVYVGSAGRTVLIMNSLNFFLETIGQIR